MLLAAIVAILFSFSVEAGTQAVHFEPCAEPGFDYVARTARYALRVNSGQAEFQTQQGQAITMRLAGARRVAPSAPDRLGGVSHYYLGSDAAQWRANVPHYSRVRWRQIYQGVDLVYYGNGREIEFDFEIGAGVNAGQIRLQFAGADGIRINKDGALELTTSSGTLLKRPPVAYQVIEGRRRNVGVRYVMEDNEVTFALDSYDRGRRLIIDPSVAYSTYLGGDGVDTPTALAVDIYGSAYVAGTTSSTFFPGAGLKPGAAEVGFLTKLSAGGNSIVYSLYLNGTPGAIAVDNAGAVYMSGHSSGNLAVKNAYQPALAGLSDAFVAKFQPDGSLGFGTYLGGSGEENGSTRGGVRFDSTGAVYVAGWTKSANFPVKNAVQSSFAGGQDAFVAKVDPTGSALVFSTYVGGSGDDFPNGFDLDTAGNPVLAGRTLSADFPTQGARQPQRAGFSDGFLTRLDRNGSRLLYSSYVGGGGFSTLDSVAASPDGTLAVTAVGSICAQTYSCVGWFSASNEYKVFYAERVPFSSVSFDAFGNLIVVGNPNLENVVNPAVTFVDPVRNKMVGDDALLMQFRPDGRLLFSTLWGGASTVLLSGRFAQYPIGAVADTSGALYLAGATDAADLYTTPTAVQPALSRWGEIFLVKFAPGTNQTVTSIRVQTNSFNVPLTVGGRTSTFPLNFQLLPGDSLRVDAPERFDGSYSRSFFKEWSNGGARSQTVAVGGSDLFLQALYTEDVRIETTVEPAGAGTIEITPVPADGFYRVGSTVTVRARPAPGYVFSGWSGDLVFGNIAEQTRVVGYAPANAPLRMKAKFVPGVPPPTGLSFVPVSPCRILDTRPEYGFEAPFGAPAIEAGATRQVAVAQSKCGIPPGAGAYALNITAVPLEPLGYLTAFATGQALPGTSTLNAQDGQITANSAVVQAGTNGAISVFASNRTHVLIDVTGYFAENPPNGLVGMVVRCRILDTRSGTAIQPGPASAITASNCPPPPGAQAAWVTVTAYPKGPLRWLSLTAGTASVSTLNSPLGEVRSNTALIPLTGNAIFVQASDTTDVTVDISMYLLPPIGPLVRYFPITPCRALDTRTTTAGPLKANAHSESVVGGKCNIPTNVYTHMVNVTVIPTGGPVTLRLVPPGNPIDLTSALQAPAGKATANLMVLGPGPWIDMFPTGDAHVILDVVGYFAP